MSRDFSYRNEQGELKMISIEDDLTALVDLFDLLHGLDPDDDKTVYQLHAKKEVLIQKIVEGIKK